MNTLKKQIGIYKYFQNINLLFGILSGILIVLMSLFTFSEVILRYVFNKPTLWTVDVCRYMLIYSVFLSSSIALEEGSHIKIDLLVEHLNIKKKRPLSLFSLGVSLVYLIILLWKSITFLKLSYTGKWVTMSHIAIHTHYLYFAMVIGLSLLILTYLFKTINEFLKIGNQSQKDFTEKI